MRAVLSCPITVERFAVFAEMAWLVRRPELGLLCRMAQEHGHRIAPATVQEALPGLSQAGADNVIAWCHMLDLCDAGGGLTALGQDVAETDEAPVPEQGVYEFWLAEHPVIGRRLLGVERLAATRDQRFEDIEPVPVEPDRGKVFRSVVNPTDRFLLRDLPSNHGQIGVLRRSTQATCHLRWTLDFAAERDQWQLDGMIDNPKGGMMPIQHEAETDGVDLWNLAASWGTGPLAAVGRWQAAERRLAVDFQGLTDEEQDCFCKTVTLRHVEVPGKGRYDKVTLEHVPIAPRSPAEAQRWAMSRLHRRLERKPGYRSRRAIRHLFAELTASTPLEQHCPSLPAHTDLLADDLHASNPEVYWNLAAPVDLAPHPIPAEELGALRIGKPAGDRGGQ